MTDIDLTIIICTYNRAALLGKCLESLRAQTADTLRYEVLVVDNHSTDDTPSVVQAYEQEIPGLRHVMEAKIGLSHARNRGFAEAHGEYLIYLDDDVVLPPDYLLNVSKVITEHQPDIMGGPVYPYYLSKKPWWFRDEFETKKYEEVSGFSTTCLITGCNYVIRRTTLERLGLFDARFGMRGDSLGMLEERKILEQYRAATPPGGQRVYYAVECYVRHYVPERKMRLTYIASRSYVAGYAARRMDSDVKGRPSIFVGWVAILSGLWKVASYPFRHIPKNGLYSLDLPKTFVRYIFFDVAWGVGYIASQVVSPFTFEKSS